MYRIRTYSESLATCIFSEKSGANTAYICTSDDNYTEVANINFINFIFIKDVPWIHITSIIYKISDQKSTSL